MLWPQCVPSLADRGPSAYSSRHNADSGFAKQQESVRGESVETAFQLLKCLRTNIMDGFANHFPAKNAL